LLARFDFPDAIGRHHAALHAGLLTMQGQAPYGIAFRWTYIPPLPAGLDPEARKVMVTRRVNEILERVWGFETSQSDVTGERGPTWDADAARSTGLRDRAMPPRWSVDDGASVRVDRDPEHRRAQAQSVKEGIESDFI
jgi:hypothetical protein